MPFEINDSIDKFSAQTALDDTSGSVADDAYSVTGDLIEWTNTDDAPLATIILLATIPIAPSSLRQTINLYAQLLDIDGTDDALVPSDSFQQIPLGSFPVDTITTAQIIPLQIALPNAETSQKYKFFIKNITGQTISAGWDLKIRGKTIGPKAA